MESDGERTTPVSAKSRHQVLRPGTRIVAEHLAPYDDGPDEEPPMQVVQGFNVTLQQMTVYMSRAFGGQRASFQIVDEAVKESMRRLEEAEREKRRKMNAIEEAAVKALESMSTHTSGTAIDFNAMKVAPRKYGSDHEPYYVKLTQKKRR